MHRRILSLAALGLCGLLLRSAPGKVVGGPMIQRLGSDAASVVEHGMGSWALEVRQVGVLAWRRIAAEEPPTGRRQHYRIEGLEPETGYEYRLLDPSDRILASGGLRTAPRAGGGRVRFGVLGDSGALPWWNYPAFSVGVDLAGWAKDLLPGRGAQWRVVERICEWDADLVLHLGDLVYPWGRRQDFPEAFLLPFGRFLASHPCYPTIGNHDLMSEAGAPFDDHFVLPVPAEGGSRRYYAFVHGPAQFICLDAFSHADPLVPGSDQWRWLRRTLDGPAPTWRVVFLHRPLWSTSNTARDDLATDLRRELHPLLARGRVDLVLSGHDHLYQRFEPKDGVTYVIEGAGGKSLYEMGEAEDLVRADNQHFSCLLAEADAEAMRCEVRDEDGHLIDRFALRARAH